jgi:hypothetical protein
MSKKKFKRTRGDSILKSKNYKVSKVNMLYLSFVILEAKKQWNNCKTLKEISVIQAFYVSQVIFHTQKPHK